MAEIRVNHADAFRFSQFVAEKQIRRALLEMKLDAIATLSHGPYSHRVLMHSLDVEVRLEPQGVEGKLGSKLPYAASVEAGARPHYIFPNPNVGHPNTRLVFYWRKVGRVVKLPFVYHPGQPGKAYLRGPLARIGHHYNMLVFTYHR
jgi:hypothetical protein